jgi:hypothetical protein
MSINFCPGPVSRRGLIKNSIAASLAFVLGRKFIPAAWAGEGDENGLAIVRKRKEYVEAAGQAKHVILLWMNGGPSHLDTFDPKPGTPYAGKIGAIEAAPGFQITERFPLLAKQGKYLCALRGVHSKEGDHGNATHLMHTGYRETQGVDYPSLGSIVCAEAKDGPRSDLPSYVALNGRGGGAGFYGPAFGPFSLNAGQPIKDVEPPFDQKAMESRRVLLAELDKNYAQGNGSSLAAAHQQTYERAIRFSRSPLAKLFELNSKEKELANYGDTNFARACYVAKRLVSEGGVRFVEIEQDGWDTHSDQGAMATNCQTIDRPFARMIEELAVDGLLSQTLIVWMGEFGRTPEVNLSGGRDHYSKSFTICLAGGGVKGGQAVGASNKSGHEPEGKGISIPDFFHTVCDACGIDATKAREANDGRPIRIADRGSKAVPGVFG